MTKELENMMTREQWEESLKKTLSAWEDSPCDKHQFDDEAFNLVSRCYWSPVLSLLYQYSGVRPCRRDPRLVAYFASPEKAKARVYSTIKPGRFLKKFVPFATDADCEYFANDWKALFQPREYDLVISKDESAFIDAYKEEITQGTSPGYSPGLDLGFELKSLSGSCMRKGFGFKHPAAAYASDDFTIVYAKERGTGRIGARVIVGNDSAGPIYTNCDYATRIVLAYLSEQEIDPESNWDGLRLAKIAIGDDRYLCPFVDNCAYLEEEDDGFVIGRGDINFHTHGYVTCEPMGYCDHCEDEVSESDLESVYGGACVCYGCRSRYYTYSDLMQDYIPDSECVETCDGPATLDWIENSGDYVFSEYSDRFELVGDCIEYEGEWFTKDSGVVQCLHGEFYHEDSDEYKEALAEQQEKDRIKSLCYETTETSSFEWIKRIDGSDPLPTPCLVYVTTKETRLRLNYELNSNGVPYRLPELDFGLVDITADNC